MNSTTKKLIAVVGLLAVALVLWLWLTPQPAPPTAPPTAALPTSAPAPLPVPQPAPKAPPEEPGEERPEVVLRLLSVTMSPDNASRSRATLQNIANRPGIAVMAEGDAFPDDEEIVLLSIERERVLLDDHGQQRYLELDPEERLAMPDPRTEEADLDPQRVLAEMEKIAERGLSYEDMQAAVWRNIGRRERPFLLVQGRVSPAYGEGTWPDVPYLGLRVRQVMPGSFWQQLGLQVDDLILAIDGVRIDSDGAWSRAMPALYNNEIVTLDIQRGGEEFTLETTTIPPR